MRELLLDFFELKYNLYIYNLKASKVAFTFLSFSEMIFLFELQTFSNYFRSRGYWQ